MMADHEDTGSCSSTSTIDSDEEQGPSGTKATETTIADKQALLLKLLQTLYAPNTTPEDSNTLFFQSLAMTVKKRRFTHKQEIEFRLICLQELDNFCKVNNIK